VTYKEGQIWNGTFIFWNQNGEKMSEETYKEGELIE